MSKEIYLKAFIAALPNKPTTNEKYLIERAYNFGYEACLSENQNLNNDGLDIDDDDNDASEEPCNCRECRCGQSKPRRTLPTKNNDANKEEQDNEDTEFYEVENSSLVSALFYDFKTGILQVELKDGKAYDYYEVDAATFNDFKNAESKGSYFNKFKQEYDFDEAY